MLYRCTHRPAWAAVRAWRRRMEKKSWRAKLLTTAAESRRWRGQNLALRSWRQLMLQRVGGWQRWEGSWVTLRARWVTPRARWVTLRAR